MPKIAIGILKKKTLRQLTYCVKKPPIAGPTMRKRELIPVLIPIALALSPSGNVEINSEVMEGMMRAPPAPCTIRPKIMND